MRRCDFFDQAVGLCPKHAQPPDNYDGLIVMGFIIVALCVLALKAAMIGEE